MELATESAKPGRELEGRVRKVSAAKAPSWMGWAAIAANLANKGSISCNLPSKVPSVLCRQAGTWSCSHLEHGALLMCLC